MRATGPHSSRVDTVIALGSRTWPAASSYQVRNSSSGETSGRSKVGERYEALVWARRSTGSLIPPLYGARRAALRGTAGRTSGHRRSDGGARRRRVEDHRHRPATSQGALTHGETAGRAGACP